ncbi:MAG: hypothetical protein ACOY5U_02340 [Pseudomonadota bacterium]
MRRVFRVARVEVTRVFRRKGVELNGAYWIVRDQNGVRASGYFTDRGLAWEAMARLQDEEDRQAQRRERPCLVCGTPFLSEGRHNRLCATCRGNRPDFQMAG